MHIVGHWNCAAWHVQCAPVTLCIQLYIKSFHNVIQRHHAGHTQMCEKLGLCWETYVVRIFENGYAHNTVAMLIKEQSHLFRSCLQDDRPLSCVQMAWVQTQQELVQALHEDEWLQRSGRVKHIQGKNKAAAVFVVSVCTCSYM